MRTDPYGDPEDYWPNRPTWFREPWLGLVVLLVLLGVGLLGLVVGMAFRALGRVGG